MNYVFVFRKCTSNHECKSKLWQRYGIMSSPNGTSTFPSFCSFPGLNADCKVTVRIVDKQGSIKLSLFRKSLYAEGDMLCNKDKTTKDSFE